MDVIEGTILSLGLYFPKFTAWVASILIGLYIYIEKKYMYIDKNRQYREISCFRSIFHKIKNS